MFESLLTLATMLAAAEAAAPSPELDAFHTEAWAAIHRHKDELDLSPEQLEQIGIEGQGGAARGGGPKPDPQ